MFEKKNQPSPDRSEHLRAYEQMVQRASPNSPMGQGLIRAFWVGGLICTLGQVLMEWGQGPLKMTTAHSATFASISLILLTALLTGLGVFDRIGKYAGAGSFVPISGFANSVVSAAMEFRREGMVLGMGAKLFSIAGPVLVWGIAASAAVGFLYALLMRR